MASPPLDATTLNLLLTEVLGVSPQSMLDDYTNIPHDNVRQITESLEDSARRWIEREVPVEQRTVYLAELESGVVALQTLIDSHSDFAFDLFEVWVWRNIFNVPADIAPHITMPHHKGLDLTITEKQESEAREELAMLRRRLEAMTRIDELLADGVNASRRRKERAEKMLHELEFLESTDELRALPPTVMSLFEKLKRVPKTSELPAQPPPVEKQAWEVSHESFLAWGASKAIRESRKAGERDTQTPVGINSLAAAEFLRQMDSAATENGPNSD